MKKVYCKHCKHNRSFVFDYNNSCRIVNEFTGLEETESTHKEHRNNDGECPYYKRKWWMYWVK